MGIEAKKAAAALQRPSSVNKIASTRRQPSRRNRRYSVPPQSPATRPLTNNTARNGLTERPCFYQIDRYKRE